MLNQARITVPPYGERLRSRMESLTLLLLKKTPPLAFALLLAEAFNSFSAELSVHVLARLTGAICGGAVTWFWRTELVRSRRVACLMFGWCAGIGFSPVLDWILQGRFPSLPKTSFLVFGSSFLVGVACVRVLEAVADNPLGVTDRLLRLTGRRTTKDTSNE